MDWKFVWTWLLLAVMQIQADPVPSEGMMGGEFGGLFGPAHMANHVPRLGRRSLNPYLSKTRNGFRFFGGTGAASGGDRRTAGNSGFYGFNPRQSNFRFYGGRPEELSRALLREKKMGEFADYMLPNDNPILEATKEIIQEQQQENELDPNAPSDDLLNLDEDQDFWKNILGEATMNTVLKKMADIGETKELIDEFEKYEKYGVGNPLPKYLARYNQVPAMTPKVKVETSYPNSYYKTPNAGDLMKQISQYRTFPRRK